MTAPALAALLLAEALQEPELSGLLRRLEVEARAARGTAFEVVREDAWKAARVQVAVDGTVRLEEPWEDGQVQVLGADSLLVVDPPGVDFLHRGSLRGACERIELKLLPSLERGAELQMALLRCLAPDRLLGFEPGLRIAGRADVDGQACVILASRAAVSEVAMLPDCMGTAEANLESRRFYVSLERPRLLRVTTRMLWTPCWKNRFSDFRFEAWDGGVPRRLRWISTSEAGETSSESVFRLAAIRPGVAVEGAATDLEARWARDPALPELLVKRPRDPELLYSAALRAAFRLGEDGEDEAIRLLDQALAVRDSETVLQGLFGLLAGKQEVDRVRALARRVSSMPRASPILRASAAAALLRVEADGALEVLPPRGFESLKLQALVAKKDFDRALALAAAHPEAVEYSGSFSVFYGLGRGDDAPAFLAALDRAPDSPLLRKELLNARFDAPLPAFLDAAERATGSGVQVVRFLRYRLIRRSGENEYRSTAEEIARFRDRLLRLLEAEESATAHVLRGAVLRKSGDAAGAGRALAEAWTRLGDLTGFQEESDLLGLELAGLGDKELFERGLRVILDHGRKLKAAPSDLGAGLPALARRRLAAGEAGRLLDDLRGLRPQGVQYMVLGIPGLELGETETLEAALRAEAGRRRGDPDGLLWLAAQMEADEEVQGTWKMEVIGIYERVLADRPGDPAALERIALRARRLKRTERAIEALRALLGAYEKGARPSDARWTSHRANLLLAEQLLIRGDREAAAAALGRAGLEEPELRPWELWLGALLRRELGEPEAALGLLRRLEVEGYRPYLALAELYEERQDWLEALRALNRATAWGAEPSVPGPFDRPVGGFHGRMHLPSPEAGWLAQRRGELRRKAGELYFIRRFLESPPPALGVESEREAIEAAIRLGSEAPEERDEAERALRRLGAGAARAMAPLIDDPDQERRARARALLSEWAEPR